MDGTNVPSQVKLIVEFSPGTTRAGAGLRPVKEHGWIVECDRGSRPAWSTMLTLMTLEKIVDYLRRTNAYYTFECYNTAKGYLQVTKAYSKSVRID